MYETGLEQNKANHVPLTPLSYIERAAFINPDKTAIIYGDLKRTWKETYTRCRKLASSLSRLGIGKGDTVSIIAANTPAMYEAHFGVPMSGAVLNTLNVRLSVETLTFMIQHAETRVLLVDKEFSESMARVLNQVEHRIFVIDIDDPNVQVGRRIGRIEYEDFVAAGDENFDWKYPDDEWDSITLSYTSGTTGNPKGVVYHHRGAALQAINNIISWKMTGDINFLWTLPMFHCNGWCYPWTIAAAAGTNVCFRKIIAKEIYQAIDEYGVNYFCGAPIVVGTLINAPAADKRKLKQTVHIMVAGAAPPAKIIEGIEAEGFFVTHGYGLTETYGPATLCEWKDEWNNLPARQKSELKARQGVRFIFLDGLAVMDPVTMKEVPSDGHTMGEVMMRGNIVMKGYVKNGRATEEAFEGGWFHSGDLAVKYPDGYIEIKDRSKDIVISGGENISTIEVEGVLYRMPAIEEAACVAKPDEKWGETVCAFIKLKDGETATEEEIREHCRKELANFKLPKTIVFQELPKTSTGKIQKFQLREIARTL